MVSQSAPPASRPAPRLSARSMLSLGTDWPLALAMASARVGLPLMSPPPVRAATSMFLISLANSLPRLASTTAFLGFVVAHLDWPLMNAPSPTRVDQSYEQLVPPSVARQLRVERRGEQVPLTHGDDPTVGPTEDLDLRSDRLDPRRPDEHPTNRRPFDARDDHRLLERVDLPAEGVAAHRDVHAPDGGLARDAVLQPVGEQDHARAGPVHRKAGLDRV